MFASLSLTSVKTARPPVTWIERAKEHTADAKQRSSLFYLLNSALLLQNKKKGGIVIAFDSCRRVFLRVSGSFCERAFFVWFAITYIGNAPFDPRTATRTGKVHGTQRADAEREDEKVDERRSTRWCASLGEQCLEWFNRQNNCAVLLLVARLIFLETIRLTVKICWWLGISRRLWSFLAVFTLQK